VAKETSLAGGSEEVTEAFRRRLLPFVDAATGGMQQFRENLEAVQQRAARLAKLYAFEPKGETGDMASELIQV
jgi:hypothetical protein